MIPKHRLPTHPGEMLLEEFLMPLGITQVSFAKHIKIPLQRVNEIVKGKRGVSPETALLLSQALDTTPEFWMNLQACYDLARARVGNRTSVQSLIRPARNNLPGKHEPHARTAAKK